MYKVVAFRDIARMGITMYIRDGYGDHVISPDGKRLKLQPDATPTAEAAWHIPDGAEHALLAALAHALGAVEYPEQLRQDYMAERKRVDELTMTLQRLLLAREGL